MIAHDDRILHWALRKLLRREENPDLAPQVLEAWERGERGTWAPGEEELEEDAPAPVRRLWPLAAAAAVVLTGGVAFLALRGSGTDPREETVAADPAPPPAPPPFARAARPLERVGGEASGPATTFTSGVRVLVPEREAGPVEILLAQGGRLLASPGTLLAVEEVSGQLEVGLELGALEVRRGGGPAVAVDTGFARLAPDPWATFRVSVEPDDAAWLADGAPSAARAMIAGQSFARVLLIEMGAGSAEVASGEKERWTLREGDAAFVLSAMEAPASVARSDVEWMVGLCRRAAPMAEYEKRPPWTTGTDLAADDAAAAERELRAFLEERPERWALLQPVLFDLLREERPESYRGSVLDVIASDPSPSALRAGRALWRELPSSFAEDHVVAFAARGAPEFQREARARVDAWRFGDEPVPVRSAAWLASEGDERGLGLLEDTAQVVITDRETMLDVFVAALALDALGRPDAWVETRAAVARAALSSLDRGDETAARAMATSLDYVESRRAAGRPMAVAFLGRHIELHGLERADDWADVERLRAALERLGS